jgi:hypothetical protein
MTTRQIRAKRLSTRDKLVVQGKLRREALPIAEVGIDGKRVEILARGKSHVERHIYDANDLVRVTT